MPLVTVGRVEDMAKQLVGKIRKAMDYSISRVRPSLKINNRLYTDRLSDLRTRTRGLQILCQRSVDGVERAGRLREYRELKVIYQIELFESKIRS